MKDNLIQRIAHQLFLERSGALKYELTKEELDCLEKEQNDTLSIKDGHLIFPSHSVKDEYVAKYFITQTNFNHIDLESVLSKIAFDIWTTALRGGSSVAGLYLSLCEDKADIWQLLINAERNAYEITSLADQFLKHTKEINTENIINLFSTCYKKFGGYVGTFVELGKRLINEPTKCHEIIKCTHIDIKEDTISLYNISLFSLDHTNPSSVIDILLKDIEQNDDILSSQSLWVLGNIIEKKDVTYRRNEIISTIINCISSSNIPISDSAIRAAINSVENVSEFPPLVLKLLKRNHTKANEFLSHKILITKTIKTHIDFPLWMPILCENVTDNSLLYSNVMSILASITDDESQHCLLIDCIFILIRNNTLKEEGSEVDYLARCITKQEDLTNKLFTLTLVDDNPNSALFSQWLSTHLMVHSSKHILKYSLSVVNDFTENDFIFLVRRMLGFITNEKHLMPLTLSLLDVRNATQRTHHLVKAVIIDELATDYPYFVIDKIKEYKRIEKRKNIKKIYNDILTKTEIYLEIANALPRIKELEPLSRHVLLFQKEKNKVNEKRNDISQQNSLAFKIATPIPLKAGIASFYHNEYNGGSYSEPSFLHSFSSSYSLPRRYVVDNIGHEMLMIMFRTAKKDI